MRTNAPTTSNNTGYGMNLTFGVNDKCPDGKPHDFWFHHIDGHKIDQCVKCGQSAETGEIPYA